MLTHVYCHPEGQGQGPFSSTVAKAMVFGLWLCHNPSVPTAGIRQEAESDQVQTQLTLIGQVITGHGLFDVHMAHWREIDSKSSLCVEYQDGTSWHLWAGCNALAAVKSQHLFDKQDDDLLMFEQILSFFSCMPIQELFQYNGDL